MTREAYLSLPHVDLVRNEWSGGRQVLVERISPTDPRAGLTGDYMFATEPHLWHECPFLASGELPLLVGGPKEEQ